MSAASTSTQPVGTTGPSLAPAFPPAEIDASCRVPVLTLFVGGTGWLLLSSVFALIASLKFHAPGLLADSPWLTYGRVVPASTGAMVYGFALQAGLGVLLWLVSRLGRTRLVLPALVIVAALFWNLGVAIALLEILAGGGTGFEWLEMPRRASIILFFAYSLIGVSGTLTLYRRREPELYVSQWFLLAALFWFPWIYSTANLLLVFTPVRGVAQAAVQWWYAGNLKTIWLGFVGLATIYYFVPKFCARPLYSRYLALFTFWTLALLGSWSGVPSGAPLPAWMSSLSTVCAVLSVVPVLAMAINCHRTLGGRYSQLWSIPAFRFTGFGAAAWILSGLTAAAVSFPEIGAFTQFTWFAPAQLRLAVYGFFGMTMFGAVYCMLPLLARAELPWPRLAGLHFGCAALGLLLFVLPLAGGGILEGRALNDANVAFTDASKAALPFLRVSILGDLLMALGHALLAVNLGWLLAGCWRARWVPALRSWTTGPDTLAEEVP
jgi:cytochrome c oxidase cbb3-type subunit I